MKKQLWLFHICLFFAIARLWAQNWYGPSPGISNCKAISAIVAVNGQLAIATGGYSYYPFFLRSTDGGQSWVETPVPGSRLIQALHFVSNETGFAVGNGAILRTTDGGASWEEVFTTNQIFVDVSFSSPQEGFAVTNSSLFFRTLDGGQSWAPMMVEFPTNIYAVETPAPGRIHLSMRLSGSGGGLGLLYSSDDGGQSWASANSVPRPVRSLHFPTESNGYGVGDYGLFVHTANGGRDWQVDTIASGGSHFNAVHFKNTSTGYASTSGGLIYKTNNGGQSWAEVYDAGTAALTDVFAAQNGRVFASGNEGLIARSLDEGGSWEARPTGGFSLCRFFEDIFATDSRHVVACGDNGAVYVSESGGESWAPGNVPPTHSYATFYALHFTGPDTGFLGGSMPILMTVNGGYDWSPASVSGPDGIVYGLHFPPDNPMTGYACTGGGGLLKTTDGGATWDTLPSFSSMCLMDIHFINPEEGWVVGDGGLIAHTENGGQSWNTFIYQNAADGSIFPFNDVFFVNGALGFAVGSFGSYVLRTQDGGRNWAPLNLPPGSYNCIHFTDERNGWLVGDGGVILRTGDGGDHWVDDGNPAIPPLALLSVHFPNPAVGFAAGQFVILKNDRQLSFLIGSASGANGTVIRIPVRVRNFKNINSFQMAIRVADPSVASIHDIADVSLPGTMVRQLSAGELKALWSSDGDCSVSRADGDIIFYVTLRLNGISGACSGIFIDDSRVPTRAFQCSGQNTAQLEADTREGEVCIAEEVEVCGLIEKVNGGGKKDVEVAMEALPAPPGGPDVVFTDDLGMYCDTTLPPGVDLTIRPAYDRDWAEGVTSNDYRLCQFYAFILRPWDFWWQKVAADVDHNGSIDADDCEALARVALSPGQPIDNNTSWRFIPKGETPLPLSQDPLVPPYPETIEHQDIADNLSGQDFVAIKIGDLDGDAFQRAPGGMGLRQPAHSLEWLVGRSWLEDRGEWAFHFRSPGFQEITSWQCELTFDPAELAFTAIEPGAQASASDFRYSPLRLEEGRLPLLWSSGKEAGFQPGEVLFSLRFTPKSNTTKPRLAYSESSIPALAYRSSGAPVELRFTWTEGEGKKARLYPCLPNPWQHSVSIQCDVPEMAREAKLLISGLDGHVIKTIALKAGASQTVILNREGLASGYYIVALEVDGAIQAREKMVVAAGR